MKKPLRFQVASDIQRDGLGVELVNEDLTVLAEAFRCDRDHTVVVNTFGNAIPLDAIEALAGAARQRLEPFEDGLPLSEAENLGAVGNHDFKKP